MKPWDENWTAPEEVAFQRFLRAERVAIEAERERLDKLDPRQEDVTWEELERPLWPPLHPQPYDDPMTYRLNENTMAERGGLRLRPPSLQSPRFDSMFELDRESHFILPLKPDEDWLKSYDSMRHEASKQSQSGKSATPYQPFHDSTHSDKNFYKSIRGDAERRIDEATKRHNDLLARLQTSLRADGISIEEDGFNPDS